MQFFFFFFFNGWRAKSLKAAVAIFSVRPRVPSSDRPSRRWVQVHVQSIPISSVIRRRYRLFSTLVLAVCVVYSGSWVCFNRFCVVECPPRKVIYFLSMEKEKERLGLSTWLCILNCTSFCTEWANAQRNHNRTFMNIENFCMVFKMVQSGVGVLWRES